MYLAEYSHGFVVLCFVLDVLQLSDHACYRVSYIFIQYIPRNMHTVFALLCFVVVKHWLIFPYPSSLLHRHCGNLMIAPVPAKQPWWIWINNSCEFIMKDCITTTKQSTSKLCAYFLGNTITLTDLYSINQSLPNENRQNINRLCYNSWNLHANSRIYCVFTSADLTHILQGYITCIRGISWLSKYQESNLDEYG